MYTHFNKLEKNKNKLTSTIYDNVWFNDLRNTKLDTFRKEFFFIDEQEENYPMELWEFLFNYNVTYFMENQFFFPTWLKPKTFNDFDDFLKTSEKIIKFNLDSEQVTLESYYF